MKASMGLGGEFRLIQFDLDGLKGSGPGGQITFEDLWERRADGTIKMRHPRRAKEVKAKNKFLKRGLGFLLARAITQFTSYPTADLYPSEVSFDLDGNPFTDLFMVADAPSIAPGYDGDVRPAWDESDSEYVSVVPPAPTPNDGTTHYVEEGRRGCTAVGTSDSAPGLRKISTAWVAQPPYGELEIVFFAESRIDELTKATGYIDVASVAGWVDGTDTFTLNDGVNSTATVFELDNDGVVTAGRVRVDYSGSPTLAQMAVRIAAAINGVGDKLLISAEVDDLITTRVNLTNYAGGTPGNIAITETVADGNFTVSGMSAATDPSMTNRQIDNVPFKAIGLARGRDCGNTETNSKIGIRAIIGLAPTIQGKCDRAYAHEFIDYSDLDANPRVPLHKYITSETFATEAVGLDAPAGYVASSEETTDDIVTFPTTPNPTIDRDNNTIEIPSAQWMLPDTIGFETEHVRMTLNVSGSVSNDGDYTIKKLTRDGTYGHCRKVEVFEAMSGTGTDTSAMTIKLQRTYIGENAFDGNVENEGLTYDPTPPEQDVSDPWATVILGEKWAPTGGGPHTLARIFATQLNAGTPTPKTIKGIRIIAPPGTNVENLPDQFHIEVLDGGSSPPATIPDDLEPANDNHWSAAAGVAGEWDFGAGEADAIYQAGQYGVEYTFTTPVADVYGIRLSAMRNQGVDAPTEIAQFMCFEEPADITLSGKRISYSIDGGSNYHFMDVPDQAATKDMNLIVDALNAAILGYEAEAIRSEFGYLWFRATVQGDNSELDLNTEAAGSTINTDLGFASGATSRTGTTQTFEKLTKNAATIIYRFAFWGNLPEAV
jgi:hypothetical protein